MNFDNRFTGRATGDLLMGLPSQLALTSLTVVDQSQWMNFYFIQDDFQVTPSLTLNVGLRYEFATPPLEKDDRLVNFDPVSGTPTRPRTFAHWSGETERPDGGAVDSAGNYWTAHYRGGKVVQLSPTGAVLAEYPVPARCPTMCAFGGPDLRTLYVTSATNERPADELARFPCSGGIFTMRVDVPGLPEPHFAG